MSHQSQRINRNRRPGIALLLVLFAVTVSATLAISFLSAQNTTIGIAHNLQNHSRARYVAESGLALTLAYVRANSDWRTVRSNGTWATDVSFGAGTFTVTGEDGRDSNSDNVIGVPAEGDGDLSDDSEDLLTLTVTGQVGGTSHVVRAVLTPVSSDPQTLHSSGAGTSTALTGTGSGAGNWDRVNEETSDDDTTYVASANSPSSQTDTYAVADSGVSSGTISSVTIHIRARKGSGGSKVSTVLRTGGTDYLGAQINLNSTTYSDYSTVYTTNPTTSAAWTWTEIDAMEIGVTSRKAARITRVYAVVAQSTGGGSPTFAVQWAE